MPPNIAFATVGNQRNNAKRLSHNCQLIVGPKFDRSAANRRDFGHISLAFWPLNQVTIVPKFAVVRVVSHFDWLIAHLIWFFLYFLSMSLPLNSPRFLIKTFGDSQDCQIKDTKINQREDRLYSIYNKDRQLFRFIRFGDMGKFYLTFNDSDEQSFTWLPFKWCWFFWPDFLAI